MNIAIHSTILSYLKKKKIFVNVPFTLISWRLIVYYSRWYWAYRRARYLHRTKRQFFHKRHWIIWRRDRLISKRGLAIAFTARRVVRYTGYSDNAPCGLFNKNLQKNSSSLTAYDNEFWASLYKEWINDWEIKRDLTANVDQYEDPDEKFFFTNLKNIEPYPDVMPVYELLFGITTSDSDSSDSDSSDSDSSDNDSSDNDSSDNDSSDNDSSDSDSSDNDSSDNDSSDNDSSNQKFAPTAQTSTPMIKSNSTTNANTVSSSILNYYSNEFILF